MRSIRRLVALMVLLSGLFAVSAMKAAEKSIYCSSYSYTACYFWECCRITCIYCLQVETGETIYENCYEQSCWGGTV